MLTSTESVIPSYTPAMTHSNYSPSKELTKFLKLIRSFLNNTYHWQLLLIDSKTAKPKYAPRWYLHLVYAACANESKFQRVLIITSGGGVI